MRNISFSLTTQQIKDRSKTVTRRLGWKNLAAGTLLQGCRKCMGLKPGEKIEKIAVIRVTRVSQEQLCDVNQHGPEETAREGFVGMSQEDFVKMFCKHMKCDSNTLVTRIEFDYL